MCEDDRSTKLLVVEMLPKSVFFSEEVDLPSVSFISNEKNEICPFEIWKRHLHCLEKEIE